VYYNVFQNFRLVGATKGKIVKFLIINPVGRVSVPHAVCALRKKWGNLL